MNDTQQVQGVNFRTQSDLYYETVGKGFSYVDRITNQARRGYAFDLVIWICAQEYQNRTTPKNPSYADYGLDEKAARQIEKTIRQRVGAGAVR